MPELRPYDPAKDQPRINPDGSVSTEITRTVQTPDGGWTNVPSLWFGDTGPVDLTTQSDDQLAQLAAQYEQGSGQVFPRYGSVEEAEKAAVARSAGGGAQFTGLAQSPEARRAALVQALSMGLR
jgi:hypothetical protein